MGDWDQLGESWNSIDVLGCLLPNDEKDTVIINARFLLRPEQHWNTVHVDIKTMQQKSTQHLMKSFITKDVSILSLLNITSTQADKNEACSPKSSNV